MAETKRYYWLKLKKDFFKRHDIRIIEAMPNGKDYVLFYLKLLVESVDHEGSLRFSDTIPYNEEMLATITNTNIDIVRNAMKMFVELKMVEILDDSTIYMAEIEKMLGSQNASSTERVQKFREKQALLAERNIPRIEQHTNNKLYGGNYYKVLERDGYCCSSCQSTENIMVHHILPYDAEDDETVRIENLVTFCSKCHTTLHNQSEDKRIGNLPSEEILIRICFTENLMKRYETLRNGIKSKSKSKSLDLDKDTPIVPEGDKPKAVPVDYQCFVDQYHEHCKLLPKVIKLTDSRKRAIKARVKEHGAEAVIAMFERAGKSAFLNGDNDREWKADFDWLVKPANFIKVVEGKYDEKGGGANGTHRQRAGTDEGTSSGEDYSVYDGQGQKMPWEL